LIEHWVRARLVEVVFDLAQGAEPVDCGGWGGAGCEGDSLVVAQRGERLDEGVVFVPAGRDDSGFESEAVDELFDPFTQICPGLASLFGQQGRPVSRARQVAELRREWVLLRCHASRLLVHTGVREAEPFPCAVAGARR
jgi:hypothetical protein